MRNNYIQVDDRCRSEWITLINEWVHDEINRKILIRHLLDNKTLGEVSAEIGYELRQTSARYKKAINQLVKHI